MATCSGPTPAHSWPESRPQSQLQQPALPPCLAQLPPDRPTDPRWSGRRKKLRLAQARQAQLVLAAGELKGPGARDRAGMAG